MTVFSINSVLENTPELLKISRKGIDFPVFQELLNNLPSTLKGWSGFLHLKERTLLRYKKEPMLWYSFPYHQETINIGNRFIREAKAQCLKVPLAVVQGEYNYLINPKPSFDEYD